MYKGGVGGFKSMPEAVLDNLDAQMAAAAEMRRARANTPFNKGGKGDLNAANDVGGSSFRERASKAWYKQRTALTKLL